MAWAGAELLAFALVLEMGLWLCGASVHVYIGLELAGRLIWLVEEEATRRKG
jgi:hypothetical protein